MASIKVYVRVRPPLPGEFDTPGCFNCVEMEDRSGNWIRIKKDGEAQRYFARVWGPQSTQDEIFRTVAVSTVDDVLSGYYGCIFVYGQTGTGKTFTLGCQTPGMEGVQPNAIKYLFSQIAKYSATYDYTVTQQYVQMYRDAMQDLLNIHKDNLKVRVDEASGATIEGVTTRPVTAYEESMALVVEGDSNRIVANTKMNSASSRSHACLITHVTRTHRTSGEVCHGRLYLIDLAGSERVSKSGVTDGAFKEAVAINKSLTVLGNCIAGLVNGEKVVSFRDSMLTRLLQHSLTGHGRTSIIVTVRPDSPNLQETVCTLKFGERAQKVEAQMTPAGYREKYVERVELLIHQQRGTADQKSAARWSRQWTEEETRACAAREVTVLSQEAASDDAVRQIKQSVEEANRLLEGQTDEAVAAIKEEGRLATETLRLENAAIIEETEKRIAEAEAAARARVAKQIAPLEADLMKRQAERDTLTREVEALKATLQRDIPTEVREMMSIVEDNIAVVKRKLRGCRQSRHEALSLMDIRTKTMQVMEAQEALQELEAQLMSRCAGWDIAKMQRHLPRPTIDVIRERYERAVVELRQTKSAPPPPSSSSTSSSSYDSDDSSSSGDGSSSSSDSSFAAASHGVVIDEKILGEAPAPQPDIPYGRYCTQFKKFVEGHEHHARLLVQLMDYLEMGIPVYIILPPAEGMSETSEPRIQKKIMTLRRSQQTILIANEDGEETPPPTPTGELSTFPATAAASTSRGLPQRLAWRGIRAVVLGQHTPTFYRSIDSAPVVPPGTAVPPDAGKLRPGTIRLFHRRSFSIVTAEGDILDIVANVERDFEAWVIALQKYCAIEPEWGAPLDMEGERAEGLDEEEVAFCSRHQLEPETYKASLEALKTMDPPLLYITVADVRQVCVLDAFHSQRLYDFLVKRQMVSKFVVLLVKPEAQETFRQAEEERARRRDLRGRIIAILRKHRNMSLPVLKDVMQSVVGHEDEMLATLIQEYGDESEGDSATNGVKPQETHADPTTLDEKTAELLRFVPDNPTIAEKVSRMFGPTTRAVVYSLFDASHPKATVAQLIEHCGSVPAVPSMINGIIASWTDAGDAGETVAMRLQRIQKSLPSGVFMQWGATHALDASAEPWTVLKRGEYSRALLVALNYGCGAWATAPLVRLHRHIVEQGMPPDSIRVMTDDDVKIEHAERATRDLLLEGRRWLTDGEGGDRPRFFFLRGFFAASDDGAAGFAPADFDVRGVIAGEEWRGDGPSGRVDVVVDAPFAAGTIAMPYWDVATAARTTEWGAGASTMGVCPFFSFDEHDDVPREDAERPPIS